MLPCPHCNRHFDQSSSTCPHCGETVDSGGGKTKLLVLGAGVAVVVAVGAIGVAGVGTSTGPASEPFMMEPQPEYGVVMEPQPAYGVVMEEPPPSPAEPPQLEEQGSAADAGTVDENVDGGP